jgi:chemotaxis protein CheD
MDSDPSSRAEAPPAPAWSRQEKALAPAPPPHGGRPSRFLHPAQIIASEQPCVVTSILGSCVAVCLVDPIAGIGGLTHYLLPRQLGGPPPGRYGSLAIPLLIEKLTALGARRSRLTAKVFGGARMIGLLSRSAGEHVGEKNAQVAFDLLEELGIPVAAEDIGGVRARKLIYYTDDGSAWVRRL